MHRFALGILSVFLAVAGIPAVAQVPFDVAKLDVLPGWRRADGTHVAAFRITLAPGWKTYWRSPGDGGIPPRLALETSGNLAGVRVSWPVPHVFDQNGLRSIGYKGTLTLPVAITAARENDPIRLRGAIEIGVCEDVCIPVRLPVSAMLPAGGGEDPEIRAALADRPLTASEAGVGRVACDLRPIRDGMSVSARIEMRSLGRDEAAVVELPDKTVWISEADVARDGGTLRATVDMVPVSGAPFAIDRSSVRITVLAEGRAVDIRGCG